MAQAVETPTRLVALQGAIESAWFVSFITTLIIANAVVLGALTYADTLPNGLVLTLHSFDMAVTCVFVIEILAKLLVYRGGIFRSGWNWFDFIIVGITLVPGSGTFTVLRALRVLRVLRLLSVVPMLRKITEALLSALPGMGAILAVLGLITYVAAVMATNMFGHSQDDDVVKLFGDLPSSAFTLFQVMTMDGWRNEVVQLVMDDGHPYAWVFFLIFIFLASFAVLNLFIALIVEALQAGQEAAQEMQIDKLEEEAADAQAERGEIIALLKQMRADLDALKAKRGE